MKWNLLCKSKNKILYPSFYSSIQQIDQQAWREVTGHANLYLQPSYLMALESSMKEVMDFRYILFFDENHVPVAGAAAQILGFNDTNIEYFERFCKVADVIKNTIIDKWDIKVMVCGNVFACGENGFAYRQDKITAKDAFENLSDGLYQLRQMEEVKGKISVVLLKEFWPDSFKTSDMLKESGFREFKIDVNMVLNIYSDWQTMDQYLESMTTKFRTKAKGVFKKSAEVTSVFLEAEDIVQHANQIESLYQQVVEKAEFRFGVLRAEAFARMKKELGNSFLFRAYYLHQKMVGFSCAFLYNDLLDANYVGLDYEVNYSHAVYQRMLYDFVEVAIHEKARELRLGRTAEEIKSCIGAEPVDMKLYMKHRNSISNKLLAPIIASISPSEFELRKPFKAGFSPVPAI